MERKGFGEGQGGGGGGKKGERGATSEADKSATDQGGGTWEFDLSCVGI